MEVGQDELCREGSEESLSICSQVARDGSTLSESDMLQQSQHEER